MIGKVLVVHKGTPGEKAFIFCTKCASIHEFQGGNPLMCPFSPYHGVHQHGYMHISRSDFHMLSVGGNSTQQQQQTESKRRKTCFVCKSVSVVTSTYTMSRKCTGQGAVVTYKFEERHLCSKHLVPPSLLEAGCFLDERQLVQVCTRTRVKKLHRSVCG